MIKFYKRNKVLCISIGGFVTLFTALFIIFYGKYDLFKFPFDANVWGNAADWIMVVGTLVSLILILQTLILQNDANSVNKRLADIQTFKHIESIKPEIKIDGEPPIYSDKTVRSVKPSVSTKYYLMVKKNRLKNVEMSIFYRTKVEEKIQEKRFPELNENNKIPLENTISIDKIGGISEVFEIQVIMTYNDIEYNKYRHTFELEKQSKVTASTNTFNQVLIEKIDW